MSEQFKIGQRVEFISEGWSWPVYGQHGHVVAIENESHGVVVEFDGRKGHIDPNPRRCGCRPGHISAIS